MWANRKKVAVNVKWNKNSLASRPSTLGQTMQNYYHNCPVTSHEKGCGSWERNFQPSDGWMVKAPNMPSCSSIQTICLCVTLNAVPSESLLINGHEIWASSLSIEVVHPSDMTTAFLSFAFLTRAKAVKAQWLQGLMFLHHLACS